MGVWVVLVPVYLAVGAIFAEGLGRWMWRKHGYCPTCDRLTTAEEVDS